RARRGARTASTAGLHDGTWGQDQETPRALAGPVADDPSSHHAARREPDGRGGRLHAAPPLYGGLSARNFYVRPGLHGAGCDPFPLGLIPGGRGVLCGIPPTRAWL
ncbi:hypothetical protein, partial [Clavibacter michiganensis]|uniref:hypothetical protein n=1 Tax=Clavibacter michiganensis TaxID=28447 RepID=UPI002931D7A4